MAGFTNIPMRYVEVIASFYGALDGISANITGKGFHFILLAFLRLMILLLLNNYH